MKAQFFISSLILLLLIILSGCDKCRNDECASSLVFPFKVLDKNGGSLVGYSSYYRPFNSDSVQVLGLNDYGEWVEVDLRQDKAVLSFLLNYEIKDYRIDYSFASDDTLSFEMSEYTDECCDQIVTDYTLRINDVLQPTNNYDTVYVFVK